MVLGLLGAAGFVAGLALTGGRVTSIPTAGARDYDPVLYGVGWIVMLVGMTATTFALVAGGGPGVLGLGYMEFRTSLMTVWFQTFLEIAHFGCVLALCGAARNGWIAPLLAWAPLGTLMLLIGLRTEALVPAVTFTIVLAHRGVHFRRSALLSGVIAAIVVIPLIRTVRDVGVANEAEVNWRAASPLETFTELGSTLRAVKAYVDWIEDGDEYLLGATYWAPFDRQLLTRVVPDREPIPFDEDDRLPERKMGQEGAVGLAATGEAFYNFGSAGPFLYFAVVGLLFGWLERRAWKTPYACALLGIAMSTFYFNIRGHWLSVPAQIALAAGLVAFCFLTSRCTRTDRERVALAA
jgi:hypothetical protein